MKTIVFLFVNATKIHQFKPQIFEIDCNIININDITNNHKKVMKKHDIK